jgi:hypothetical protein
VEKQYGCVQNVYQNLNENLEKLSAKHREYSAKEQDLLHYIEFQKYDAIAASKLVKTLRQVRQEMRVVKDEYDSLYSFKTKMDNTGYPNAVKPKKIYSYRSTIIQDVLGDKSLKIF